MKTLLKIVMIGIIGNLAFGAWNAHANFEVSAAITIGTKSDFYAPLAAEGTWIEVASYGRCWRPGGVIVGWRPYCDGYWEWTDCGWFWVSDEPWAWACYHYGRWIYDPVHGWIWIPGIEWAPAWVEWRVGGGYIGWAPLGATSFVFVQSSRFNERVQPSTVIVNNTTLMNKTTVINNIKHETRAIGGSRRQTVVVDAGPGVASVQKAIGRKIKTVPIQVAAIQSRPPASFRETHVTAKGKHTGSVSAVQGPKAKGKTLPSAPTYKQTPGEKKNQPNKSPSGKYEEERGKGNVGRSPDQSPEAPPPEDSSPGQSFGHAGGRRNHFDEPDRGGGKP